MTRRRLARTEHGARRSGIRNLARAALVAISATGCFPPDAGVDPDSGQTKIYFPVGLALSPPQTQPPDGKDHTVMPGQEVPDGIRRHWLYLANSDFDLQFNAGTVQVYDLSQIETLASVVFNDRKCPTQVVTPDNPTGAQSAANQFLYPGPCDPLTDFSKIPILHENVKIGAFATDVVYMRRPPDATQVTDREGRLVVPVRGDDTLHWLDASDKGTLECGQHSNGGACDDNHRRGSNASADNTRDATLPPQTFGIAADERGESVVTTHQSDGAVGLFVNQWGETPAGAQDGPTLQFVLGGLPLNPMGIATIPQPDLVKALAGTNASTFHEPAYYVAYRTTARIDLVRYFSDQGEFMGSAPAPALPTFPTRAFLDDSSSAAIQTNSQGFDSRGVAVDQSARQDCETACSDDPALNPGPTSCRDQCVTAPPPTDNKVDQTKDAACNPSANGACAAYVKCLRTCASTPLDVYVSNRSPSTLIVGQSQPTPGSTSSDEVPRFNFPESVSPGPSRVVVGDVLVPGPGGTKHTARRVFIICFDSRKIFVYDPKEPRRFEAVIQTGRGPHALAIDETRGLGYVGHFTDSYLGVVDLDQSHPNTYGQMILTIGQPVPPRAQK